MMHSPLVLVPPVPYCPRHHSDPPRLSYELGQSERFLDNYERLRHCTLPLFSAEGSSDLAIWVVASYLKEQMEALCHQNLDVVLFGAGAAAQLGGPPSQRFDMITYIPGSRKDLLGHDQSINQIVRSLQSQFDLAPRPLTLDSYGFALPLGEKTTWYVRMWPSRYAETNSALDTFQISLSDGAIHGFDPNGQLIRNSREFDLMRSQVIHRICEPHQSLPGDALLLTLLSGMNCGARFTVSQTQFDILEGYLHSCDPEVFREVYLTHVQATANSPEEELIDLLNLFTLIQTRPALCRRAARAILPTEGTKVFLRRIDHQPETTKDLLQVVKGILLMDLLKRTEKSPWIGWDFPELPGDLRSYLALRSGNGYRYLALEQPGAEVRPIQLALASLQSREKIHDIPELIPLFTYLGYSQEVSEVSINGDMRHCFVVSWESPWFPRRKRDQALDYHELFGWVRSKDLAYGEYQEARYRLHCWCQRCVSGHGKLVSFADRLLRFTSDRTSSTDCLEDIAIGLKEVIPIVAAAPDLVNVRRTLAEVMNGLMSRELKFLMSTESPNRLLTLLLILRTMGNAKWLTQEQHRTILVHILYVVNQFSVKHACLFPLLKALHKTKSFDDSNLPNKDFYVLANLYGSLSTSSELHEQEFGQEHFFVVHKQLCRRQLSTSMLFPLLLKWLEEFPSSSLNICTQLLEADPAIVKKLCQKTPKVIDLIANAVRMEVERAWMPTRTQLEGWFDCCDGLLAMPGLTGQQRRVLMDVRAMI